MNVARRFVKRLTASLLGRDQRRLRFLEDNWHDLRYAARTFRKQPTFTLVAVLTLALGIAGTTVMFALIHGVLLRPLPLHEPDRLILAWREARSSDAVQYPFGDTEIEAVAEYSQLLESAAGVTRNGVSASVVTERGTSTYANVGLITGGFFDVLGVRAVLGRGLTVADDDEGAARVVVISHGIGSGAMAVRARYSAGTSRLPSTRSPLSA